MMNSFSRKSYALAAGAAFLGLGVFLLFQQSSESLTSKQSEKIQRKISITPIEAMRPDRAEQPLTLPMQDGPGLNVAMDEVCVRDTQGLETFVKLDPPATPETLRARIKELENRGEVLPVAYPEGAERSELTRAIITKKLRVQLPDERAENVAAGNQLNVSERPPYAPGWTIMEAEDALAALAAVGSVRDAGGVTSADVLVARQQAKRLMPNDTLIGQQWHLKNSTTSPSITHINVEDVWKYDNPTQGFRGAGTSIGIVDDGLQWDHPDLNLNVDRINGYDWNAGDNDASPALPYDNHGTACAGVAAALGNNSLGVSGVAPEAVLVGMRLISASTTDLQEAEAMAWKSAGIFVKNNSWGPQDTGQLLQAPGPLTISAMQNAVATGRAGRGTIFVWAGGNGRQNGDNSNYDGYANRIEAIAVGGLDSNGQQSAKSESGANLIVVAPTDGATSITTTDRTGINGFNTATGTAGNYYSGFGGTSSAAPVVSGVVALMLQRNPSLGWRDVQEILIRSATKPLPADSDWKTNSAGLSFNHKFGAGLVNASAAVNMASTWVNLASQSKRTINSSVSTAIPVGGTITRPIQVNGDTHRIERVTVTMSAVANKGRGSFAITLTSPSGMTSRLAEIHNDPNTNYSQWTFSSVRHWGESTAGTWTLQITDAGNVGGGGTLNEVALSFYGVSTGAANPPPVVQFTTPTAGQAFPPGSTVPVTVTATDLTISGTPGTVTQVELIMDGLVVGTVTTAPYQFSITPANGTHTLVARATDDEGETGTSPTIQIFLQDRPPTIYSATLSATNQGFSDTALSITSINAVDPEGAPVILTYQWQSSTDDRNFTNAGTSPILTANASNAGKIWKCVITPSDGNLVGEPFETAKVNIVNRPPQAVKIGATVQHDSGLVIAGAQEQINRPVIINEVSTGISGTADWVELLMLKTGDLVGYKIGHSTKSLVFKDVSKWKNIAAGKIIIIYKGTNKDTAIPTTTNAIIAAHNDTADFDNTGGALFPIISDGGSVNLEDGSNMIHRITFGAIPTGTDPGNPAFLAFSGAKSFSYLGGSEAGASLLANWSINAASNVSPGVGNSTANSAFVTRLVNNDLIEASPLYRLNENSVLPTGLSLNTTTGRLSGTIAANAAIGNYSISIERYNKDEEYVAQTFTLRVYANNYSQWIGSFPVTNTAPAADSDGDGIPNLVEYALDRNPNLNEPEAATVFGSDASVISLTYKQSKVPTDVTLVPEWSTNLDGSVPWQTSGITTTILSEDALWKSMKASVIIHSSEPKRFLRLKATLSN